MRIVIFGGGGFIGSAIVDRLLIDGHELRIFERPRVVPYRKFKENEQVAWVTGDLFNTHDVYDALEGVDAVFHLVSTTLPKNSNDDPIYDVQTNLLATLQMLDGMVAQDIRKIIFISSGGTVYGKPIYLPIDEKHPTDPIVSYGITKLAIEKYMQLFEHMHRIKATTLRVANAYGERQRIETAQGAIGVFIQNALKGIPLTIWGDGSVIRDYIHVSDVAEAFALALEYSGACSCFNISSGVGTSLNELIGMLGNVLDKPIEHNYLPGRPFDVPVSVLSNALAREELQWDPKIPMKDGIARTVKWMKNEFAG